MIVKDAKGNELLEVKEMIPPIIKIPSPLKIHSLLSIRYFNIDSIYFLSTTNLLLKEQTETLTEDKEKLLTENETLEKQQKKLQQEINKMAQSKEVMERNIHAYDEDVKWQLAEPGALMSTKAYRDKKAVPLVEKLKELVKNLTIKCVQLTEQGKKLTAKVDGQQKQISCLTDNVMEKSNTIDRLQEKAVDLGSLERYLGRERVH